MTLPQCADTIVALSAGQVAAIVVMTLAGMAVAFLCGRDEGECRVRARQQLLQHGDDHDSHGLGLVEQPLERGGDRE